MAAEKIQSRVEDGYLIVASDDGSWIVEVLSGAGIYPSEVKPARASLEAFFLGMTTGGDISAEDVR